MFCRYQQVGVLPCFRARTAGASFFRFYFVDLTTKVLNGRVAPAVHKLEKTRFLKVCLIGRGGFNPAPFNVFDVRFFRQ